MVRATASLQSVLSQQRDPKGDHRRDPGGAQREGKSGRKGEVEEGNKKGTDHY